MKVKIPEFYKDFKCAADKCSDSCCIGWEIDIDGTTYSHYMSQKGDFGERLRRETSPDPEPHFTLSGERCPFLNEKNLCDIYINLGEENLCEICTEHPRFHEWFGDYKESGLGLCCEEACRLLFRKEEKLKFQTIETSEPNDDRCFDEGALDVLYSAREAVFEILQNRNIPLKLRLLMMISFADDVQDKLDNDDLIFIIKMSNNSLTEEYQKLYLSQAENHRCNAEKFYFDLLELLSSLEPISDNYPSYLDSLKENLPHISENLKSFSDYMSDRMYEYEHLAVYTVYRYWLKGVFNGEIISRVNFAVVFVASVFLFDCETWLRKGDFKISDRINNVKMFSKEIEYCEENLEKVLNFNKFTD